MAAVRVSSSCLVLSPQRSAHPHRLTRQAHARPKGTYRCTPRLHVTSSLEENRPKGERSFTFLTSETSSPHLWVAWPMWHACNSAASRGRMVPKYSGEVTILCLCLILFLCSSRRFKSCSSCLPPACHRVVLSALVSWVRECPANLLVYSHSLMPTPPLPPSSLSHPSVAQLPVI